MILKIVATVYNAMVAVMLLIFMYILLRVVYSAERDIPLSIKLSLESTCKTSPEQPQQELSKEPGKKTVSTK